MPISVSNSKAVVFGGTGAVGAALVKELLASPFFSSVRLLVRKSAISRFENLPGFEKYEELVANFSQLEADATELADGCKVAFCTFGTGQPRKVSKEEFWKVDVEYVRAFGKGCKFAGVEHMSLLSSAFANSKSSNYYLHIKGSAEEALKVLKFEQLSLFRPSLLVTKEIRYGFQDVISQNLFPLISWALPQKLHEVTVENLAHAMLLNAEMSSHETIEILHYKEFQQLLENR